VPPVVIQADVVENPDAPEEPGPFLRRQRAAAGLTQEDLAERSGVTARTIGNLERGRAGRPYPGSVRRVAAALGLSEAQTHDLITRYRRERDDSTALGAAPPEPAPSGTGTLRAPMPVPVPRQLPAAIRDFAGRAGELEALAGLLADSGQTGHGTAIALVTGMAGVGKTALAVHWAHQVASLFPDGQLYLNLRGFDPGGAPVAATEAVRGFLDALGVAPERIPAGLDGQAGLYRSVLADRRMLVVLDNALDEQQVRPLIPASPGSMVLVTSRRELAGLAAADGAQLLSLDVLSSAEARQVLTARIGVARVAAEPDAVTQIADLCGFLALALTITAARAAARPHLPLAVLAAELRDAAGRLDALDAGDTTASVRTVFSWSYQQLRPGPARMFRLLGVHPGPDISIPAAASLTGIDHPRARSELTELSRAHLISEHVPGRYALHDLLRAYAASQAHATDSDTSQREATGRVLDYYLHTAYCAARLLEPTRTPITLAATSPGVTPGHIADLEQAMAWFQAEQQTLLAAITLAAGSGFDIHAWQLPWTMSDFLGRKGHWLQWAESGQSGLAAATRLEDTAAQAVCHRLLSVAWNRQGDQDRALTHLTECLKLYRQLGDRNGEAHVHGMFGQINQGLGRYAESLGPAEQALRLFRAVGDKVGQATMLGNIGFIHAMLGDYERAREFCRQALVLNQETDDRLREAAFLDSLGYAEQHLGNQAQAADYYARALALLRELGARYFESTTLTHLGDLHCDAGDTDAARCAWQQALGILDDLQHRDAEQVRAKLASLADPGAAERSA
jgi:tetratricopeptide (TPR) repeat protein/transcriptional regulator with XRE-family HTH domain